MQLAGQLRSAPATAAAAAADIPRQPSIQPGRQSSLPGRQSPRQAVTQSASYGLLNGPAIMLKLFMLIAQHLPNEIVAFSSSLYEWGVPVLKTFTRYRLLPVICHYSLSIADR